MNGEYVVASGGKFDVPFNTDYASKGHEYFDVWAPEIASHYGNSLLCVTAKLGMFLFPLFVVSHSHHTKFEQHSFMVSSLSVL